MAESIESEDGQNWTITLKDGFTFHNGEPVDARILRPRVELHRLRAQRHPDRLLLHPVEGYDDLQGEKPKAKEMAGLTAPDDLTIEVTLPSRSRSCRWL